MKTQLQHIIYLISFCLLFFSEVTRSQCPNQVTHLTGTSIVNGVSVAVSSNGNVDANTAYCISTNPYFVGYNSQAGSGNGSYIFDFTPPISSLTLDFSGISNAGIGQEAIVLTVNGAHYPVTTIADPNNCDPLASINTDGDITGCTACSVSGWLGTTITGPISSLVVSDIAIWGSGNGAIFSLYICDPTTSALAENSALNNVIYPNPFSNELNLNINSTGNTEFVLYDAFSKKLIDNSLTNNSSVNTEHLVGGIYFYELKVDNQIIKKGKLVKN